MATTALLTVTLGLSLVQNAFGCSSGWVSHNDKCYLLSSYKASWPVAASYCRTFNSKLAEPMDQSSVAFLSGEVKGSAPMRDTTYYLGGGDLFVEGEWIWMSTQAAIGVTNWNPGEPNDAGGKEDCVEIALTGLWNDDVCDQPKGFICEMDSETAQGLIG
ncbi:perlucin-like [Pecten maximus]|uniref:perlucin-like n=1 Tax=Pecten maximus TaxID=6579 RepID=UPI0014580B2F|nr:perlucin-like [Pecten maximus]